MMTIGQNFNIAMRRLSKRYMKVFFGLFMIMLPAFVISALQIAVESFALIKYGITCTDAWTYLLNEVMGLVYEGIDYAAVHAVAKYFSIPCVLLAVLNILVTFTINLPAYCLFLKVVKKQEISIKECYAFAIKSIPLSLLISIKVFLWSLLFIIPGIIKSFAYSQAYFVKAEHPEYRASECISLSCEIMNGRKAKYFGFMLVIGLVIGIIQGIATSGISTIITVVQAVAIYGNDVMLSGIIQIISLAINNLIIPVAALLLQVIQMTMQAVFYEDAKRSRLSDIEMDLRFKHESGAPDDLFGDSSDPFNNISKVTDVENQPDYNDKKDDNFDPFA